MEKSDRQPGKAVFDGRGSERWRSPRSGLSQQA
jgi:hypothetical protein